MSTALIILAAGKGTRMESDLPKVMHELGGAPLFAHAWAHGRALDPERVVIVAGHGAELVEAAARDIDADVTVVVQEEQLGTAHAVAQARSALEGFDGDAVVLYGDTPFTAAETLERLAAARDQADVVVLGFDTENAGRYGRLVMDGDRLSRIVEFKDATDEERAISLCNSGVVAAKALTLFDLIDAVGNDNASGEYYLTDIVEVANTRGLSATAVSCAENETLGINNRAELVDAESLFQSNARASALENGVTLLAPETVFFSHDTVIGREAVVEPNVVFAPGVTVESGARIRAFSHLEGCHVSKGAIVGPYARLRPGAELANNAKIGNFVEIKNAQIGEGAKVNHLSYVGDASVGEAANLGAGTVTCNYDGVMKHHTHIGARAFIGSDTMLVAPVTVGDDAMTTTGAVITKDVPDGAMAVARAEQVNKPGLAIKFFARLRALKARKGK
ncbi:bifunctional UDP-N-acetylglucosamine diphosphorylase/glucosamine-1-phosphate N-acetyltransferase GlmU [Aliiroseovarius subalbicans]|uniref:bifunctional UDP-N-acetylglucosamine diphosphorylase/glucosamine-1-phosphate N-acetyltransferase GlmU n=1 Tax=Aliiroseovarius subalbicans TaxID=2925840 RepID=UPI001F55AEB3|nr:bifunctional UDP-N-acetylglucosamine diphosphorylase/glucosamine-1-phosphate N-acetyltransferase GlmU [Aliiroseovarius subalbicans]MCI2398005.1 bifunctional UDP-N-acetylglucosamine diphosphorylase/glucosamine-1-phosphate N-acetyltransferase GlmU [Aliiroseovarius subalbicans]